MKLLGAFERHLHPIQSPGHSLSPLLPLTLSQSRSQDLHLEPCGRVLDHSHEVSFIVLGSYLLGSEAVQP